MKSILGLVAGYFVYTEEGRKLAKEVLHKTIKEMTNGLNGNIRQNEVADNVNREVSSTQSEVQHDR